MSENETITKSRKADKIFHFILILIPMHAVKLITGLLPNSSICNYMRGLLYRPFFRKCGINFQVASGVIFVQPQNIEIGNNVYIAHNSWIGGSGGLSIEDEVVIGPMVTIVSGKHTFLKNSVRYGDVTRNRTTIRRGSWLASHVTINGGVTIGEGVAIGANSVVTKDIPDNAFAGGVPAKVIRK